MEWHHLPTFFAVERLNLRHALERRFGANLSRAFLGLLVSELDLALIHKQFPFQPNRLQRLQGSRTALGFNVLGNQLIDGW